MKQRNIRIPWICGDTFEKRQVDVRPKVVHLVAGSLEEGAARGAYWLHRALRELGVDSTVITNSRENFGDQHVARLANTYFEKLIYELRIRLLSLPIRLYRNREQMIFNTGLDGLNFMKHPAYKAADVVHLHWINGLVSIGSLRKINKPIVWTMRDMWPMTGGCHVAEMLACENYKFGCGFCKQLRSQRRLDLSRLVVFAKKTYLPKEIKMVGISHWLSAKAKEASVFHGVDVRAIYNNIDTKEFLPVEKAVARDVLGISTEKKIILAGANNARDIWKGFEKFIEAMSMLDKSKYFLCFFGHVDKTIDDLGFELKNFGRLRNNYTLRLVYSAADVFVAPSLTDAFGKTLAEAMACGTPVVTFDATGPKEIVTHKVDGYKARPFESSDLAKGIEWVMECDYYNALCLNARQKVVRDFDSSKIAKEYIKLYAELLNERNSRFKELKVL